MAETAKPEQPQTNGLENGLDEDERSKMRPADIDADVKEMERRKRVEMIMSSKLFREELERIIELQLKDGNGPAGLLQQISDMMGIQSGKLHTTHMFRGSNCVTPINDIRGVESMGYEKGEKNLRCKLASVFRLMDLYGWSQGINNQITARLNQDEEHFLVNPHGMLFNEITASSLVKVDMQGNIVEPGTTNFSVNTQGFLLHSAIHASRPDVNCVIHIKTPSVLAVSSLKCGLLPICQEALVIGEVSQHPFVSGIFEPEEREKIIRNLGPHNKVLLLHNHGAVCCGATVEEAFYNVYNTVLACETQMKLMPIGVENLLLVSDETRKQVYDAAHRAPDAGASGDKKKFRVGEMEFEALIRMLDNAGFRTGYIYRHPLVKGELPKPKNDVEVPPAVSSLGYLIEQEELYKQGNWKKYIDGRNRLDRTKWLNSPNVYQKVEILETGTSDPKKITKWVDQNSEEWVAESSPTHSSTPVKIDSALQFVPKGTNPKEFKKLQQQIKENRRADKITSGPQSHILEGVSWEEAKKLQDANITQTGDQVILVGAASKGIIQRNYQHNALVYKTPYAKNPFDSMSDKEIEDYKQLVERKQRGDTDYEESQSESEAISSSRQDALRHFKSPLLSPQSATSETEEESRDEPRVLRIETKTAPRPIQAEVVLSDGESDTTDARVERSHSARYPKAEKPESVTLMNSFRKSWSLKREKDKSKASLLPDVENTYDSRNLHFLKECELEHSGSLHCYVARVKQLTHKPIIVDLGTKSLRPLLKSASDPCNLSTLNDDSTSEIDNRHSVGSLDVNTSLSCSSINTSELQQRLNVRRKLLHSAKMKFLGYHNSNRDEVDKNPKSPMRVLISEIRETISEIMSPERTKNLNDDSEGHFDSLKWFDRTKFESLSNVKAKNNFNGLRNKDSMSKSLSSLTSQDPPSKSPSETFSNFKNEFNVLKMDIENSERSDTSNCNCAIHGRNLPDRTLEVKGKEENQPTENIVTEVVNFVNGSDDEATYTVTEDSLLPTYSYTESTETEWYYNKTIMKLENSQTVLEIRENENKEGENMEIPNKYIDTGIDTDFTSDKEVEMKASNAPVEEQKEPEPLETTEDLDNEAPVCESSGLNKSSETDSSFLKSSSGRTSNDVDSSLAFKTETENSEKTNDKSPEKSSGLCQNMEEKKNFLKQLLQKTKEPIQEESSDSEETNFIQEKQEEQPEVISEKPAILESPEFTNIDTEDAPITSSSKDTSPEVVSAQPHTEQFTEPKVEFDQEKENIKEPKRKKSLKSGTKITVKKELKEKDSNEPVVSEIKLTIKNLNKCQSEKYEVKIQDVTNTSEDLSRSVSSTGENIDGYESFEIVDKDCDCEAQQNLEELQDEVSSTIEKLQTIENYFEDEIKKHSNVGPQKRRNGSDEFTIEYNYREFEEVLNESRSKVVISEKDLDMSEDASHANLNKENTEFFISSPLSGICGEIEVCDDADVFDDFVGDNTERGVSIEDGMENLVVGSAFVAAILSEAVLEVSEHIGEKLEETVGTEIQVFCNIEELPVVPNFEVGTEEVRIEGEQVCSSFSEIFKGTKNEQESQKCELSTNDENIVDLLNKETENQKLEGQIIFQDCQQFAKQSEKIEGTLEKETPKVDCVDCFNKETESQKLEDEKIHVLISPDSESENCDYLYETYQENRKSSLEQEVISEFMNIQMMQSEDGDDITYQKNLNNVEFRKQETNQEFNQEAITELTISHILQNEDEITYQDSQAVTDPEKIQERQSLNLEHESFNYLEKETRTQLEIEANNVNFDLKGSQGKESNQQKPHQESEIENLIENYTQEFNLSTVVEIQKNQLEQEEIKVLEKGEPNEQNQVKVYSEKEEEIEAKRLAVQECQLPNLQVEENLESSNNKSGLEVCQKQFDFVKNELSEEQRREVDQNESVKPLEVKAKQDSHQSFDLKIVQNCQPEQEVVDLDKELQKEMVDDTSHEDAQLSNNLEKTKAKKSIETAEVQDCRPMNNLEENQVGNCPDDQTIVENKTEETEKLETQAYQHGKELNEVKDNLENSADVSNSTENSEDANNTVICQSQNNGAAESDSPTKLLTSEPAKPKEIVNHIVNSIINTVTEKNKKNSATVNDVINFIVNNEESPTDSLAEFEDMENIISTSSSVVADIIDSIESQMEGEVESLPDEDELREIDGKSKKKRKKDEMFKVTIATPAKKEIFINYSLDHSSTFNTSSDLDQIEEFCNSYIKTDDVNDDFENLSSENVDFFSIESSERNSLNSSFCSIEETGKGGSQFCCVGCETNLKSAQSLAIIQEVDEGDSSTSSDVAAS